jgi:hypothetical protein
LSDFYKALDPNATIGLNEVYLNDLISNYLNGDPGTTESVLVYPNPAIDMAFIRIPEDVTAGSRILVYDIQGKQVMTDYINGTTKQIDVSPFRPGIYRIVIAGEKSCMGKLVIKR